MNRTAGGATVVLAAAALALAPARTSAQAKGKTPAPAAIEREPGVVWEHTVSMEMAGFSMPGQTSRICKPRKDWNEPPGSGRDDEKCKVTDVRRSGQTMTWKVACEGKEKYTGEGEMTWAGDAYTGKMTMHSADGDMLMRMKGRQTSEACDAGEAKRQVAAIQAQAQEHQAVAAAQVCESAVQTMNAAWFTGAKPLCVDAAARNRMCDRTATRAGYLQAIQLPEPQQRDLAQVCGRPLNASLSRICADTLREEAALASQATSAAMELLAFIEKHCPVETKAVAQRECAGQEYSTMNRKYRDFCVKYGAHLMAKSPPKAPAASPAPKKPEDPATDAAKKAVKGLFGF
jgi:hypothetical protein